MLTQHALATCLEQYGVSWVRWVASIVMHCTQTATTNTRWRSTRCRRASTHWHSNQKNQDSITSTSLWKIVRSQPVLMSSDMPNLQNQKDWACNWQLLSTANNYMAFALHYKLQQLFWNQPQNKLLCLKTVIITKSLHLDFQLGCWVCDWDISVPPMQYI